MTGHDEILSKLLQQTLGTAEEQRARPEDLLSAASAVGVPGVGEPPGAAAFPTAASVGAGGAGGSAFLIGSALTFIIKESTCRDIAGALIDDMKKKKNRFLGLDGLRKRLDWMRLVLVAEGEEKLKSALGKSFKAAANAVGGTAGLKTILDANAKLLSCDSSVAEWLDEIEPPDVRKGKGKAGRDAWKKLKTSYDKSKSGG